TLARDKNKQISYPVIYSGGSFPTVKSGEDLKLFLDQDQIRLTRKHQADEPLIIKTASVTELTYGAEAHRRVGTAVGVGLVTFGLGGLIALSHSKKHYIGIVWDAGENKKGGLVLQADKNEYRGILAALEGITGKKAVDSVGSQKTVVVQ
ncbi:MAG: hypothetical protein ABSF54_27390, partial [Bryobacteraceae bacterium]